MYIVNQPLGIKVWDSQRVVTFNDVDRVHQRPRGTASRNFRENREHFIEGVDYYDLTTAKFQSDEIRRTGFFSNNRGGFLLTEMGYLMLVKSFTDDLAWQVQRSLVQSYFRGKEDTTQPTPQPQPPINYNAIPKLTFGGNPVMTVAQLIDLFGVSKRTIADWTDKVCSKYSVRLLTGELLSRYGRENNVKFTGGKLFIYDEFDVLNLAKVLKVPQETIDFINDYFKPTYNPNLSEDEFKLALQQADLLYKIAKDIQDPYAKEQNLKAVTAILINIGLWTEAHHGYNGITSEWSINSTEGWNKRAVMLNAKRKYLG